MSSISCNFYSLFVNPWTGRRAFLKRACADPAPSFFPGMSISQLLGFNANTNFQAPHKRIQRFESRGEWLDSALDSLNAKWQRGVPISTDLAILLVKENLKHQDLNLCKRVNKILVDSGLDSVPILADHLIRAFASCGSLDEAILVFSKVKKPSRFTWNAIISAHAMQGRGKLALQLYLKMQREGINPDRFTFLAILKACSSIECLEIASRLLCLLPDRDIVSWNAMIAAYVQCGKGHLALEIFGSMQYENIKPDLFTYSSILKACSSIGIIEQGRRMHEQILDNGFYSDVVVGSTLVDMYARCGGLEEASKTFDSLSVRDAVLWNAMITGFVQYSKDILALQYFDEMQHSGTKPSKVTYLSILQACGSIEKVRQIHEQVVEDGLKSDTLIATVLVDVYAKFGSLEEASRVFNKVPNQDVVLWDVMLSGYVQNDRGYLALQCFEKMHTEGIKADKVTLLNILKACGCSCAIDQGRRIHEQIIELGLQPEVPLGNALVDAYIKCGSLEEAERVFSRLPNRDIVTWNTMIAGYAQLGEVTWAAQCFYSLQHGNIKLDVISFTGILIGCSRAGLVDEGRWYFRNMTEYCEIECNMLHIACMVDLLGHGGYFKEAGQFLEATLQSNIYLWRTLLDACKMHHNIEFGTKCFQEIVARKSIN